MSLPSTFAIPRGAFVHARSPAGVFGYEAPEFLVIVNTFFDTVDPTSPHYRVETADAQNVHLEMNWPAMVGISACRIAWGDRVMFDGSPARQAVKAKYCALPLYVTFLRPSGLVDSCPVLSFQKTHWMARADRGVGHLSLHQVGGRPIVDLSLLQETWSRAMRPSRAAIKAAQDVFDGLCTREEGWRRINAAYRVHENVIGGGDGVNMEEMNILERMRSHNLPQVALERMNAGLTHIRQVVGMASQTLHEPTFILECDRAGMRNLAFRIRGLLSNLSNPGWTARDIVKDYACVVLEYPLGTFDRILFREMETVNQIFQNHCAAAAYTALQGIVAAYTQHRAAIQRDAVRDQDRAAVREIAARAEQRRRNAEAAELAAWHRERQEEDEQIEDAIEENRQEMAEHAEAQMEAEEAAARGEANYATRLGDIDELHTREERLERVAAAAQDARNSIQAYLRVRNEMKAERDATVPQFIGGWIKKPTADGRGIEEGLDEMATVTEVREGTDGCPWPFFVYENHVKAEIAKGGECPITMTPLSLCKSVNVSMNCGHIYESKSIVAWTNVTGSENAKCPSCRAPIAGMWQMRVKSMVSGVGGESS